MLEKDILRNNKKLGMTYTPESTTFRVWSPDRENIKVVLYDGPQIIERKIFKMNKHKDGVHEFTINSDLKDTYYTFLIDDIHEVTDPYGVATSLNGIRSVVVDLDETNPEGWKGHYIPMDDLNCASVIYELHIKDFTFHSTSGVMHPGKYLGITDKDSNYKGYSTGLSHLKELGITHVHLMPVYDYLTVNEDEDFFYNDANYNWGYDPEHFNVPEGSYATEPDDPKSRIRELKQMIMALHQEGFKVVIDVVYNHTYRRKDSNFNLIMPNYYYRLRDDGSYSNGSGCGNEIASEKEMVRAFIIDSLKFWTEEYKVDGFRFDLMALIDIDTVEEAINTLREINPNILIYGEPWAADGSTLPIHKMTTKGKQGMLSFAFFNDDFRNAIKGDSDGHMIGFAQGDIGKKQETETGIAGSIYYDDSHIGFTSAACETINYINAHDNLIMFDKIKRVFPYASDEEVARYNRFAFSILLTSQGIPFIHAGNEFLRTKYMDHNSYRSPISVNAIDWSLKEKNIEFFNYFKDLIKIKKNYEGFRINKAIEIKERLKFLDYQGIGNMIVYSIEEKRLNSYLLVIHNGNNHARLINTSSIWNHLQEQYKLDKKEMHVKIILNQNGLVREEECGGMIAPYAIEVEAFTTLIYEMTFGRINEYNIIG